jgi:molybdopterin molybdotransferase
VISVADALRIVVEAARPLGAERVGLLDACGRVAAGDVVSGRAVPAAANSAMDGYAVRAADVGRPGARLRVAGSVPAGSLRAETLAPGTAVKIFTGSVVPPGADTVVRVEDTEAAGDQVTVSAAVAPGANVRLAGEDIEPGAIVVRAGQELGPADVGVLASVGRSTVLVHRRPQVAIVSTGAELVEIDEAPGPGQVVNSNAWVLAAAAREAGAEPLVFPVVRDRFDDVRARLAEAAVAADVVLSTGGVSVGDFDFVRDALEAIGVERAFWKVAQKPGKPLVFGRRDATPFFGLPGNPVSSLVPRYAGRCAQPAEACAAPSAVGRAVLSSRAPQTGVTDHARAPRRRAAVAHRHAVSFAEPGVLTGWEAGRDCYRAGRARGPSRVRVRRARPGPHRDGGVGAAGPRSHRRAIAARRRRAGGGACLSALSLARASATKPTSCCGAGWW